MKRTIILSCILILMSHFCSCDRNNSYVTNPDTSEVILRASVFRDTRSSLTNDTDAIHKLSLYFFNSEDGTLAEHMSGEKSETYRMILPSGTYNVYALANTDCREGADNEEALRNSVLKMDLNTLGNGIPMCWRGTIQVSAGQKTEVDMTLERLVSTIWFSIDMGLVEGLEITAMKLCQAAVSVRPFIDGGSMAQSPEDVADGDYATDNDLAALMSGESICFLVPENCQGLLLPDNTDPWAKVPDNIPEKAGLCSYIEMKGRWREDAYYTGEITYRFFLGEDPVSSFDVRRNSMHSLVLCPDEANFDRISWKIDTSQMGLVGWGANSDLSRNFHDKEHFCVTERIRADIVLDRYGIRYWETRENGFFLAGLGPNGETRIRFDDPVCDGEGVFHAMGTCIGEGEFELVLCDSETGERLYLLDAGKIIPPILVTGYENSPESDKIVTDRLEKDVRINGDEIHMNLFLTDQDGYNLNNKDWYGCDLSVCAWRAEAEGIEDNVFDIRWENGTPCNGGYAAKCRIKVTNDGTDIDRNRILSRHIGVSGAAMHFTEDACGVEYSLPVRITCDDIGIIVRPAAEETQSIFKTDFMYVLDNPSNLPVSIKGIRLNSMEARPTDERLRNITGWDCSGMKATQPLVISKMPETICSFGMDGTQYMENGEEVWFAAAEDGVSQADMPAVPNCMFLVMEAELALPHEWSPKITGQIEASGYDDRYGKWCGMYFYAGHSLQDRSVKASAGLTDFTAYGNILDRESIEAFNEVVEVDMKMNDNNEVIATASEPTYVDVNISGTLYGHIRCITIEDPFDIVWGHYFKDSFPFDHQNRHLISHEPQIIDGSCLAEVLVRMRNEKYYSALDISRVSQFRDPPYPDQYGTIREYLKPYDLDMSLKLSSDDGTPVAVSWSGIFNYEHTISDPVTWPKGLFGYITIVPSTYSGYDRKVDEDGCPPGRTFIAEKVTLDPDVEFDSRPEIFLLSATPRQ